MGANPPRVPSTTRNPTLRNHPRCPTGILVATLILGVLSYQLNASMLVPALPDMAESLNTSM